MWGENVFTVKKKQQQLKMKSEHFYKILNKPVNQRRSAWGEAKQTKGCVMTPDPRIFYKEQFRQHEPRTFTEQEAF